jgi:hypothetical protein
MATAAAAIAVAAGGCGTVEHSQHGTLNVALTEYRIVPRAMTVGAGVVRLIVRNNGRLTHNLVVRDGVQEQGATPSLAPGAEAPLVLILSPGRYTISSTILQDADLGARATLTVTRSTGAGASSPAAN